MTTQKPSDFAIDQKPELTVFKITPHSSCQNKHVSYYHFIESIQQELYEKILYSLNFQEMQFSQLFHNLHQKIPILNFGPLNCMLDSFSFVILCHEEYALEAEKYIPEMLHRFLMAKEPMKILGSQSLKLKFANDPYQYGYYFMQYFVSQPINENLFSTEKQVSLLLNEMRLHMLAVYHAKCIAPIENLSIEQKSEMVEKKLFSKSTKTSSLQIKSLITQLSTQKKLSQIKENIALLMNKKPKAFDHNIFENIYHVSLLFIHQFTSIRETKHLSRIISYFYWFSKKIKQEKAKSPDIQHISLRLFKVKLSNKNNAVLGILTCFSLSSETQRLEKSHVLNAIYASIKNVQMIKNSLIIDRREEKIRCVYLEIEKKDGSNFSLNETHLLKKQLPLAILSHTEKVVHDVFKPENDEEIMRNLILLSKQLVYVKDLPQVMISYDRQVGDHITFMVILVRILRPTTKSLDDLFFKDFSSSKFAIEDIKILGLLKKKYEKEASIFKVSFNKKPFFRSDHSLDVQKARQKVVEELTRILGEFRDFNGGMILAQTRSLTHLKKSLAKTNYDAYLLENLFYSLKPGFMQSILSSKIIRYHFLLLLKMIHIPLLSNQTHKLRFHLTDSYFHAVILTPHLKIKKEITSALHRLNLPSLDLTSSCVSLSNAVAFGFIYRFHDNANMHCFKKAIKNALKDFILSS